MKKILLWVISIFLFLLNNNVPNLGADTKKEIEIHICGTKEKSQLKCFKGSINLFNISLERYEVKNSIFIAEYKIIFPEVFKVKMNNNVKGYNALGEPAKIVTSGFLMLDKSSSGERNFQQLVNFSFNISAVEYSVAFFLPQSTYNQYCLKQVSSNSFLFERKAEINPRLMAALSYSFGVNNELYLKSIPDDFEISINWTENGTTFFFEKILYLP